MLLVVDVVVVVVVLLLVITAVIDGAVELSVVMRNFVDDNSVDG